MGDCAGTDCVAAGPPGPGRADPGFCPKSSRISRGHPRGTAIPELEMAKKETKDEILKQVITVAVDAINGKKPVDPNMTKK